jgi:uncharacterized protein (DUF849 family)
MAKIIIEAAINGAVAKKSLNPNFAYSPQEIADDAIATCDAGAAIVHFTRAIPRPESSCSSTANSTPRLTGERAPNRRL